jgi:ankyrin repeat protein
LCLGIGAAKPKIVGQGLHLWSVAFAASLLTSCASKPQNVTWREELVRAIRANDVERVARVFSSNSIQADTTLNNNLVTPLMVAVRAGSADVVRWLLDHGATVDAGTKKEDGTALLGACDRGFLDVVKVLVERGADPNRQDSRGWTPLSAAIAQDHTPVAEYLITRGANIHDASVSTERSILMLASERGNTSLVRMLIDKGAAVNHTDEDGDHALLEAAVAERTEVVALLVKRNAKVDLQNSEGWTALSKAAALGHCEVVKVLCEAGADPSLRNKFGRTALAYARGITGTNDIAKVGDITAAVDKGLLSQDEAYYAVVRHGSGRDYDCIIKVLDAYEEKFSARTSVK